MQNGTIRLFGPPSITVKDIDMLSAMPIKGFALLGYLGMEGGSHRREKVAALLWPDTPESRRRGNLRTLLYDVNKIAPDLLDIQRQTVRIASEAPYEIDLLQILALLKLENVEARGEAARRLRGPFLQEVFLDDAFTFEAWLQNAQAHWRTVAVGLLQQSAATHLASGQLEPARARYEQLLQLQPWHEETHRDLMRLFVAMGDYSAALHQFQSLKENLARELDLPPEALSVDLKARIQQLRSRSKQRLPQQPTPFVGRGQAIAQIQSLLHSREHRCISILGPGGIGKTRLAVHIAERVGYLFLDGVFFVQLANVPDSENIFTPIAQALDLHNMQRGDIKAAVLNHLREREIILVLDNFEHLVEKATMLADILSEAPGLQILVTSRESLGLRWETRIPLKGLPSPSEEDQNPLNFSSMQLFSSASQRVNPGFNPAFHIPTIMKICRQAGGIPLAIELAGALIEKTSPEVIAAEIEQNLELLRSSDRDIPDRHRSMRAVFEYSWRLLSLEEQTYLSRLAVFRGGFSPDAARKVTDCPKRVLFRLAEKSLLSEAGGRYDFHELIRGFAAEKFAGENIEVRERHASYFSAEMSGMMSEMVGLSQPVMIQKIREEYANFRSAWDFSLQNGVLNISQPLLEGFARYFDLTSLFMDGEALMADAERKLTQSKGEVLENSNLIADLTNARARFYNKQGRFDEALPLVKKVAQNENHAEITRASACLEWGWALWHTGQYVQAETPLVQGQQLALRAEAPLLIANMLRNLGIVAWYQSKFEEARTYTQQAHDFHREIGDLQGMADALNNLALVSGDEGDYLASLAYLEKGIAIKKEIGDKNGQAISSGNLGILYTYLGMYAEAEKTLKDAILLTEEVGNFEQLGHAISNFSGLLVLLGRYDEAKEEAERGVQIVRKSGDRAVEGYVLEFMGLAHEGAGELSEAEAKFKASLALRKETGLEEMIYLALGKLTYNALLQNNLGTARGYVQEMQALFDRGNVRNVRILQIGAFNCFRALHVLGDKQALEYLRQAVQYLENQAEKILDPGLRRSFLENIEEHRLIAAARKRYLS